MKLVIAIIKPSRLEEVRQALNSLDVHGMTVTEVKGYGRQKGHSEIYRGTEYAVHFLPKLKIEIAVDDGQLDAITTAIREFGSDRSHRRRQDLRPRPSGRHPYPHRRDRRGRALTRICLERNQ